MLFKNFGVPINAQRAKSGLRIGTYQRAKRQYIKDIRGFAPRNCIYATERRRKYSPYNGTYHRTQSVLNFGFLCLTAINCLYGAKRPMLLFADIPDIRGFAPRNFIYATERRRKYSPYNGTYHRTQSILNFGFLCLTAINCLYGSKRPMLLFVETDKFPRLCAAKLYLWEAK